MPQRTAKQTRSLPSFVWIIIFIVGIVALIGGFIGGFVLLSTVEGVGSVVILVVAWVLMRATSTDKLEQPPAKTPIDNFMLAFAIFFFAMMGVAIDQTGNYLYNRPLQWFFCPAGTELVRDVDVTNPRAGETRISQDFACRNERGRIVAEIGMFPVIGVRFVEYVLIGYVLVFVNRIYSHVRYSRRHVAAHA
jgi:hypothetical protein